MVSVLVREDYIRHVWICWGRWLGYISEGRSEDGDIFPFAFACINQGVWVLIADDVCICA